MTGSEGAMAGWVVLVRLAGRLACLTEIWRAMVAGEGAMAGTEMLRRRDGARAVAEDDTKTSASAVGGGWGVLLRLTVLMARIGLFGARTTMLSQASSSCDPQLDALPHLAAL